MSTNSSRTLPRPKSLVVADSAEFGRMKKYKSVVTLRSDPMQQLQQGYQRNYVSNRSSPARQYLSTSPTHEAVLRKQLSKNFIEPPDAAQMTSEYYSMVTSHSSAEESDY